MVAEVIVEVAAGVVKFIVRMLAEVVIEILIKGTGTVIFRLCGSDIDTESSWVIVTGILFWVLVIFSGIFLYNFFI